MITDSEANDEQFRERVAICMSDGNLSEQDAVDIARLEKIARDRAKVKPNQSTMKWGK